MNNIVTIQKGKCTADPLYQWDLNRVLEIRGLSLPSIPEIHFTNDAMTKAIVRQSTMDDAGIITVNIPNSLLQKPYPIKAYVCIYEGNTFKSLYLIVIPIKTRNKPGDYTLEDDPEVYSFNALENKIDNALAESNKKYNDAIKVYDASVEELNKKYDASVAELNETIAREIENAVDGATGATVVSGEAMAICVDDKRGIYELTLTFDFEPSLIIFFEGEDGDCLFVWLNGFLWSDSNTPRAIPFENNEVVISSGNNNIYDGTYQYIAVGGGNV